jgi:nucleotidyltransferase/DNA polymerase involved in DNA repair
MDAFFAAIEERDTPRFAGQPIVVGADLPAGLAGPHQYTGRGVVSTANYVARAYGIRSAMPIQKAWKLSENAQQQGKPPAIFVRGSWRHYSAVSDQIMNIIAAHAPHFLVVGVDEAYADFTFTHSYEKAHELAAQLRAAIFSATRLTASVGVAPNKLVAKIASDFDKPNGLVVVYPEHVEGFLAPLSVRALPGVGPHSQRELARHGIRTVADLQRCSPEWLKETFGRHGESLFRKAHGQGSVSLAPSGPAKSISEQVTFRYDTLSARDIIPQCLETCERVWQRVGEDGFSGWRTVTVTARFASFVTLSRAKTFRTTQTTANDLKHAALRLLLPFLDHRENPQHEPLRLIGVRVAKLIH